MHRLIQDHLEEVLAESKCCCSDAAREHLEECEECRSQVAAMENHAALLRSLRTPVDAPEAEITPRPGFYARVMERIEAQGARSIWQLFFESTFGRRIAIASMAFAVLLSVYLVSLETTEELPVTATAPMQLLPGEDQPGMVISKAGVPDKDSVLVNLVTYREQ
jgi:predicted anti-sigma-YlaC factor YlaD